MSDGRRVAVLGATGTLGRELLAVLEDGDEIAARRQWELVLGMRPAQLPIVAEAGEEAGAAHAGLEGEGAEGAAGRS